MSDPLRPTAPLVELKDCDIERPTPGSNVLALQHGGKLVEVVWTRTSHLQYDAWCRYPKTPASVKIKQLARFAPKKQG